MIAAYIVAFAACLCTVLAQLLLKHGAGKSHGRHAVRLWWNAGTLSGYALFFAATLFNLKAFQVLPLKSAVIFQALTLVAVVAGACLFFKERLTRWSTAGLVLVLVGVGVFNLPT